MHEHDRELIGLLNKERTSMEDGTWHGAMGSRVLTDTCRFNCNGILAKMLPYRSNTMLAVAKKGMK